MDISRHAARAAQSCARHPWWVLALVLLVSGLSAWAMARLPVYTSRQALLPQNTVVAERFNHFLKQFGAASDLIVVVEGAPRGELEQYATQLAERLRAQPGIAQASERLDTRFFLEHAYLLMTPEQLGQFGQGLDKLAALKPPGDTAELDAALDRARSWLQAPPALAGTDPASAGQGLRTLAAILAEWRRWLTAAAPPTGLDWSQLLAQQPEADTLAQGYFASRDGRMLFLFVHAQDASEEFAAIAPFVEQVRRTAQALAAETQAQGRIPPKVGLTGLPAVEYEEYIDIEHDITLVVGSAAVLIAVLILGVVRDFRWALAIFVPMGLGALWSLGLAWLSVGHLTIITSGFLAILFGLGADYGIFTSSRIAEERRAGKPLIEAIGTGIGSSFGAVFTAGGASVLIFCALATVEFPGFAELGRVAAGGVLLILASTWMVQPALYAMLPPKLKDSPAPDTPPAIRKGRGAFPLPVAALLVVVAVAGAGYGVWRGTTIPFDYDALSLLPQDSEAAHYQRRMVAESDYQAEVVIFTAKDMAEARRIAEDAGKRKTFAKVQSLTGLFPTDAGHRLAQAQALGTEVAGQGYGGKIAKLEQGGLPMPTFERLRALLPPSLARIEEYQEQAFSSGHSDLVDPLEQVRNQLTALQTAIDQNPAAGRERSELFFRALLAAAGEGLAVLETWSSALPLTPAGIPASLRDRFFAKDGTIAVYAFPAENVYDPANLERLTQDAYSVSPEATGFPITHQEFTGIVVRSFFHGTLLALAVCLVWLALALRDVRGTVLAALPLLIGGGWMLGIMALAGIKYNYANIIALPLVIALAVDYGVWFSHRWRELQDHSPLQVSLVAGKVILLAAGTELAGLGAITLASYRGVSTLGVDITIGLLCCLPATLLVAPAIGQLLDPKRGRNGPA